MLKIRYNEPTGILTGWCGDVREFSELVPRYVDERVAELDIPIPPHGCGFYKVNQTKNDLILAFPIPERQKDLYAKSSDKLGFIAKQLGLL
jgi:hypothetical protein